MFSELDDGAFIERHKISALASALPEDFIRKYFSAIDTESLAAYEQALESIPRWKDAHYDMYPRKESVLDHVIEMLKMVIRIEKTCPELSQMIDMETVRLMVILHDSGETLRGDVPLSVQVVDGTKKKQHELAWSLRLMRRIKNGKIRDLFSRLLQRAHTRAPDDREALLTKFLDSAQAIDFGNNYIFPIKRMLDIGYRGTGLSKSPDVYATQCVTILNSLGENPIARREFLELAEALLISKLEENNLPPEDSAKLHSSLKV